MMRWHIPVSTEPDTPWQTHKHQRVGEHRHKHKYSLTLSTHARTHTHTHTHTLWADFKHTTVLTCTCCGVCLYNSVCVYTGSSCSWSVPNSTPPSLFACWIIQAVFDALPINQSQLSSERPDSHEITCKSIYTCQQFDLPLKLYTKYIMKLSEL